MSRKASQFLTKEQRLKVYRKVRQILKNPETNRGIGFCKAFENAAIEVGLANEDAESTCGKLIDFEPHDNVKLAKVYPEMAPHKPSHLRSSSFWFSPWANHLKNAPRVRIMNEVIKSMEG